MSIELVREGRLLRIALNRPEKRNALNIETCHAIAAALNEANADPGVGAILLTGNGKVFCAGMDLSEAAHADLTTLARVHERLFTFNDWMTKPVVAAVHGAALAGGTGLAANAHIIVAAEDATFGLTEIRLGLWPVLIFPVIEAAIGGRRTMELALTGRIFDASEATAMGLVAEVLPAGRLMHRAAEIAAALAQSSSVAINWGLEYVLAVRGKKASEAASVGRVFRNQIMQTPDFAEGLRAFQEKRTPVWPSHNNPK